MEKMPMCRICLVENVRMYIVNDKDLQKLYETLTDIPFVTEDSRPLLACFICCTKLKQCCQLQRKCLEAEELFAQMMNEPNLSVNRGHLKYSSGLIVTPVENISIVDVSIAIKGLPAVCEKLDDVIEPKKEYLRYDLELERLSNSYSDAENNISEQQSEAEDDVPLMEIKTEVEEQEVSRKKRRASDTTRAAVEMKWSQHIQGIKLEDVNTENHKKNEELDTKVNQYSQNSSSNLIPKSQEPLTLTIPRVNNSDINTTLDTNCRNNIRKHNVKQHTLVHTGEKPFKCDFCSRCFHRKDHLTSHIRTHTREKPYECEICHVCFSQKVHLTSHIRTHTGKKPYKCEECQHSFSRKDYLKRHIRGHTGERPYKCDICERTFRHKSLLTRHRRVHTGEKPYKCEQCHLCFRQKAHLTGHIRTHTGEKPYKCDICQRIFSLKSDVTKHNMRVHTGEKPFKCNICEHVFNYKGNLMRHIRVHSGPKGREDNPGATGT